MASHCEPQETTSLSFRACCRGIAALYVSLNTVKSHSKGVYRKLGASSRDNEVERARELGRFTMTARAG